MVRRGGRASVLKPPRYYLSLLAEARDYKRDIHPHMRAMASLWGLNQQLQETRVPLQLALTAFMASATELPEARALAIE